MKKEALEEARKFDDAICLKVEESIEKSNLGSAKKLADLIVDEKRKKEIFYLIGGIEDSVGL